MPKRNAYAAFVDELTEDEFGDLLAAVSERRCREERGLGALAEAAELYRPEPSRPNCGPPRPFKGGRSESGLQRRRCRGCETRCNSLTGTVLEHCRKDLPTWVDFISLMRSNVPLDAAAEMCRIAHQTAWGAAPPRVRDHRRAPGPTLAIPSTRSAWRWRTASARG